MEYFGTPGISVHNRWSPAGPHSVPVPASQPPTSEASSGLDGYAAFFQQQQQQTSGQDGLVGPDVSSMPGHVCAVNVAKARQDSGGAVNKGIPVATTSKKRKEGPTLSRNQACRTCRSRKVRCDAVKPGCGACCKSATVQGKDASAIVCEYDTEPDSGTGSAEPPTAAKSSRSGGPSSASAQQQTAKKQRTTERRSPASFSRSRSRSPVQGDRVGELERQIAALENQIRRNNQTSSGLPEAQVYSSNGQNSHSGLGSSSSSDAYRRGSDSTSLFGTIPPPISYRLPELRESSTYSYATGVAENSLDRTGSTGFSSAQNQSLPLNQRGVQTGLGAHQHVIRDSSLPGGITVGSIFGNADDHPAVIQSKQDGAAQAILAANVMPRSGLSLNINSRSPIRQINEAGYVSSAEANQAAPPAGHPSRPSSAPAAPDESPVIEIPRDQFRHQDMRSQGGLFDTRNVPSQPPSPSAEAADSPSYSSLFWPNWPAGLPPQRLLFKLCEVYFSKNFLAYPLLNKARFMANLSLPPNHRDFPHVALIHAVLSVATKFTGKDALGLDHELYWRSEPSPTDYHAACARQHIDGAMVRGDKLFSVAQAIILSCFYSYTAARFVEVWLMCGLATRICSPLGLNHLEGLIDAISSGIYDNISSEAFFRKPDKFSGKGPQTEEEKQEHAHVFWHAFMCDRIAAACTGWALSLAEEEISTLLPKPKVQPGPVQQITPQEMEQLSLSSATFFTSNSLPLVDATNLQYKSVVLLGRVCSFLRSAAWPVGSDIVRTARFMHRGGKPSLADVASSPEFKRLDALIVAFRMSFPKEYKNILGKDNNGTEITLISAHVIPHASTILLHEAFCIRADDVSMQRCLTSARAILGIIYLLWDTNKDVALLQPFICFCYAVAGRTLIRDLAFKQEVEDETGAACLMQEINVIISALSEFAGRSPLAGVIANSLRSLLSDPSTCHPRRNGAGSLLGPTDECISGTKVCEWTSGKTAGPSGAASSASVSSGMTPSTGSEANTVQNASLSALLQENDLGGAFTPSFSGLLWELEQPGFELPSMGGNVNYKNMELDLRSVLGPSFDQLMSQ